MLLRHLRALLALLFDGVPDAAMLAGPPAPARPHSHWRAAPARLTSPGSKRYDCRLRAGALLVRAADRRAGPARWRRAAQAKNQRGERAE